MVSQLFVLFSIRTTGNARANRLGSRSGRRNQTISFFTSFLAARISDASNQAGNVTGMCDVCGVLAGVEAAGLLRQQWRFADALVAVRPHISCSFGEFSIKEANLGNSKISLTLVVVVLSRPIRLVFFALRFRPITVGR